MQTWMKCYVTKINARRPNKRLKTLTKCYVAANIWGVRTAKHCITRAVWRRPDNHFKTLSRTLRRTSEEYSDALRHESRLKKTWRPFEGRPWEVLRYGNRLKLLLKDCDSKIIWRLNSHSKKTWVQYYFTTTIECLLSVFRYDDHLWKTRRSLREDLREVLRLDNQLKTN